MIKSSHKWTRMLCIILNSKLGIWLCSQPRIDINSKSKFYDVLTRSYKYLSNTLSTLSTEQHALNTIYMLVSPLNNEYIFGRRLGLQKLKGIKNDVKNRGRKNKRQNKLPYRVYVRHGETNTLNTNFPVHVTFWGQTALLTQRVFLMNAYKYFKVWYDCIR